MLDLRGNLTYLLPAFCLSANPRSSLPTEQDRTHSIVTRFLSKFKAVKSLTSCNPLTISTFQGLSAYLHTQTFSILKVLASLRHANLGPFFGSGGH